MKTSAEVLCIAATIRGQAIHHSFNVNCGHQCMKTISILANQPTSARTGRAVHSYPAKPATKSSVADPCRAHLKLFMRAHLRVGHGSDLFLWTTSFCLPAPFLRFMYMHVFRAHPYMHLLAFAYYLVVFLMYRHSPHDIRMIQSCPCRMCWQHAGQDEDEDVVLPDLTIFNNRIWKGSPVSEWWVKKELNLNFMITIWQTRGHPNCICCGGGQENNAVQCQSTTWSFSTVVEGFFSGNWLNCWSGEKHFKSSI